MTNDEIIKEVKKIVDTSWSQGAGRQFIQLKQLLDKYEFDERRVPSRVKRKDTDDD